MTKAVDHRAARSSFSMKNLAFSGYALFCYLAAVASLVYFILFVNDLLLASTVNSSNPDVSPIKAIVVNLFALSLFAVQHSVMARKSVKRSLCRFVSPCLERSTYCLATAIVLSAMCWIWIPFGGVLWSVETPWLALLIQGLAFVGWALLLAATFMLDHFELFGIRQGIMPLLGRKFRGLSFKEPGLYRIVRHPIQTGVLVGVWFVPLSTASHFMMAMGLTIYIFVGLHFEEKDLRRDFGARYADYASRVKRLVPFIY